MFGPEGESSSGEELPVIDLTGRPNREEDTGQAMWKASTSYRLV